MANPLLCSFFEETESRMTERWKRSSPEDTVGRETVFRYLAVLQEFRAYLEKYLAEGPAALEALETLYGRGRPNGTEIP